MRRIDVIGISLGLCLSGAIVYGLFRSLGLESVSAGLWSQTLLVVILLVWVVSYLVRVVSQKMTYNEQLQAYEQAVFQKRLEQLSPEELAQLQAEVDAEKAGQPK
jgi:hypothetical protein